MIEFERWRQTKLEEDLMFYRRHILNLWDKMDSCRRSIRQPEDKSQVIDLMMSTAQLLDVVEILLPTNSFMAFV
jgi:hypothetical protein